MKILIIYGKKIDINAHELYECAKNLGHDVTIASISDIAAYVGPSGNGFFVKNKLVDGYDVCFLRSLGTGNYRQISRRVSLLKHMEESGIYIINPVDAFQKAKDKYSAVFTLARSGIPVLDTIVTESAYQAYTFSKSVGAVVFKPLIGSMGYGSVKFEDPDLAYNAFRLLEEINQPLYVQRYLPINRDLRVFVIGDRALSAIQRIASEGQWKANVAQGASFKKVDIPKEIGKLAVKACRVLGLDYAGVDIIESPSGPYVLEVNSSPSWQSVQKASGINIAEQLIKYVEEKLQGAAKKTCSFSREMN